jgi:hypothetical protein
MALLRWIYLRKMVAIEDLIAGAPGASARAPVAPSAPRAPQAAPRTIASAPGASAGKPEAPRVPEVPKAPEAPARSPKDAFLNEIRKQKMSFYSMVVAQAQKIELSGDQITFSFSPPQKFLHEQVVQGKAWLESLAQQATGRRFTVASVHAAGAAASTSAAAPADKPGAADRKSALREQALADPGVQAMLEIFPADIRDVEEM